MQTRLRAVHNPHDWENIASAIASINRKCSGRVCGAMHASAKDVG